ncbi:unnamed protein product, partial [Haemonchus placei]|uniref:Metallophosphoesterase n=1 Tax=Haemonchus placei TaxID=6290 RepID=A0A0N4X028_HAEPC
PVSSRFNGQTISHDEHDPPDLRFLDIGNGNPDLRLLTELRGDPV